jgi:aminoglycoside 6'-N-acetyltransferase I
MDVIHGDPQAEVFVAARPDGRLGGFLDAGLRKYAEGCDSSPVGYIEGWYVDEDLRRLGLGGGLVQAAEAWARSLGCQDMASDCLLDNLVSLSAHLALGYEEVERLIHFRKALPFGQ